jgi:hypothetical protein
LRPHSFVRTLAVAALIAIPSMAMAAPDQNTNGNNNSCRNGQWVNGQCVYNNNNNNNNNNNGQQRRRDRDDQRNRNGNNNNNGTYNNGYNNGAYNNGAYNNGAYNNGAYNNGAYNNGAYNNGNWNYGRGNTLTGTVSSFSPYNLYLSNGRHVDLHNGTVINPTGINLSPGMRVRIVGNQNSDGSFNANEIDVVR